MDLKMKTINYDAKLLFPVLFLVGAGIVMVYSASSALALEKYGTGYYFLKKQAVFSLMGMLALVACSHFPYQFYRHLAYPLLIMALIFLAAVRFTGFGHLAGGATRWIRFGRFGFQPSEFARFALIIYLAYSLSKKKDMVKNFYIGFLPHVLVFGLLAGLIIAQPDFGSVAILGVITWIMIFAGGGRIIHLSSSFIAIAPLAVFLVLKAPYRAGRLMSFLDPWRYSTRESYQVVHSMMAFGTGGIWGTGIGTSYQKLFYLPEPHTDFIFSVIGEEVGLVGVLIILGLYVMIFLRGIQIAINCNDRFGALVATGLTTALGLQVCVNMGVTLDLLPTKGLTLPFLSYGGTSLLMNMASIGILMNISSRENAFQTTGK